MAMKLTLPMLQEPVAVDWNAVYTDQLPRIYNFFRYRVGHDVAEDLTATTFEKAWRKRDQYRGNPAGFATWLFTIARNVANDYFRQSPNVVGLELALHLPSPHSPDGDLEREAEFEQLSHLLAQLPPREREIIALKYGAELNNRQIAGQLHLSESNIGSILYRTIRKLRDQWEVVHEG